MKIYLEEKIGDPDLFVGRDKQLADLLKWTGNIKKRISMSRALLSRRKTGKTAILQRLYNLVFHKNEGLIPFYFEVKQGKIWVGDFCRNFFLAFILHYTAFKTRKTEYLRIGKTDFQTASDIVCREGLEYLASAIEHVSRLYEKEYGRWMWDSVREIPYELAWGQNESILQIIDEFQYLNSEIYRDKECTNLIDDMASGYMSTAEYKNAPLLVSGSWVGWLMNDLIALPGRFQLGFLENMPENEIVAMVFKYSDFFDIPVTDETAFLMAQLSEGNPFYASSLFKSPCPDKRLDSPEGVLRTLVFETLDDQGLIKNTWMEYLDTAFKKVNDRHAKRIVLYLSKNRDRELTREEILEDLELPMDDRELEKKLKALARSDIIQKGSTNFDYRGVQDNIFDKVFRGVYQKEIEKFQPSDIADEYKKLFEEVDAKYRQILGKYNQAKGAWAEFLILRTLRREARRKNEFFRSITRNLPEDFRFVDYESVWSYTGSPIEKRDIQLDVFARAKPQEYTVIGEVKNRDVRKFSRQEAEGFLEKMRELADIEKIGMRVGFVFSVAGFAKDALEFFEENGIAWSEDQRWLGD